MKRKSKLYEAIVAPFLLTKIDNWQGKEFCSVQCDLGNVQQYLVSSKYTGDKYQEIRDALDEARREKRAIKVLYRKVGGKRFINQLG